MSSEPQAKSFPLAIPVVEAKFLQQRLRWAVATAGLFGMVVFFALITTPLWPTTARSPSHGSIVDVALLFIAIVLPFAALFLYAAIRDAAPRPVKLEVGGTGFSILDRKGGVRHWGFHVPTLRVAFIEHTGDVWGQPVVGLVKPRFPSTFIPREGLGAICETAERAGLQVQSEPAGPERIRWTVRPAGKNGAALRPFSER